MSHPTWTCDACHQPIGDDGCISVSIHHANEYGAAITHYDKDDDLNDLRTIGETLGDYIKLKEIGQSPWRSYHTDCDPEPDGEGYYITTDRLTTWPEVVGWQSHLNGKRWFPFTDWTWLLMKAAGNLEEAA